MKASIRNALLNANRAEQKHWDQREPGDDDHKTTDMTPFWAGEEALLDVIDEKMRDKRIVAWVDGLPPKLAPLWHGLYARDLTQRELATEIGVSQPCICQRNGQFLERARNDLEPHLAP